MVYKGSVAFSAGCRSGYRDGLRDLKVMRESLSGGRRREIQEDGIVMLEEEQSDTADLRQAT